MLRKETEQRLLRELKAINKEPVPHCVIVPSPKSLLEWHYVLYPPSGPYARGEYCGRVVFPREYPFKPPAIYMDTPSGRFEPGKSICLSMSEYHPESWNPLWCVSTIMLGLLSFMLEETRSTGTVQSTRTQKIEFAEKSMGFNNRSEIFLNLFAGNPMVVDERKNREQLRIENTPGSSVPFLIIIAASALGLCVISVLVQIFVNQ